MLAAMFINIDPIAGMIRRDIREKSPHKRTQRPRDPLHDTGALGQTHHAEPKRHDPDQPERDRDRRLRAVERAAGHLFQPVVPAADHDRANDQRQPDVIEHDFFCSWGR